MKKIPMDERLFPENQKLTIWKIWALENIFMKKSFIKMP